MNRKARLVVSGLAVALVAACGGGGSDAPSGPAEGVYGGPLTGSTSSYFQMLVLENDEFWVIYGAQSSTTFLIAGFIQGAGTSNNGTFSSSALRDYGFVPALAGTASANYNTDAKTISGTANFSGRTVGFSGGPIPGSLYNYGSAASTSTVAGSWSVGVNTGETANLTISAGGALSLASSGGCTGTGSIVPRASGKNVFNVAVTFAGTPCLLPGSTVTGIAIAYPLSNGRTQLIAAARNSAQTAGFLVAGTR
jgi:hypothetical protein